MNRRTRFLVVVALCWFPSPAAADWLLSPYVGLRFAAESTFLVGFQQGIDQNKFAWGASFGLLSDKGLGVEADLGWVPGFFENEVALATGSAGDGKVVTLMGNVILATPLGVSRYGLRPYVIGGVGVIHAGGVPRIDGDVGSNLFGMNVGGGAIGPLTPRTSARFDLRYFRNLGGDEDAFVIGGGKAQLSFWRASAGLTFRF